MRVGSQAIEVQSPDAAMRVGKHSLISSSSNRGFAISVLTTEDGTKELIAMIDGQRESEQGRHGCQVKLKCVTVHEAYPFLSRVGRLVNR